MATTTAKAPLNLFAAVTKVKDTAAKKTDKKIFISGTLTNEVEEFLKLKQRIDTDTANLKMLEGTIKTAGRELYLEQYVSKKMKPESFKIQDKSGSSCLFMVQDKYTVVDETKAAAFENIPDVLESKTVYTMNPELVEKYAGILSGLIMNCEEIAAEDKMQLISGELSYSIQKGAIDRLMQYDDPKQLFELINPIVALKK